MLVLERASLAVSRLFREGFEAGKAAHVAEVDYLETDEAIRRSELHVQP